MKRGKLIDIVTNEDLYYYFSFVSMYIHDANSNYQEFTNHLHPQSLVKKYTPTHTHNAMEQILLDAHFINKTVYKQLT